MATSHRPQRRWKGKTVHELIEGNQLDFGTYSGQKQVISVSVPMPAAGFGTNRAYLFPQQNFDVPMRVNKFVTSISSTAAKNGTIMCRLTGMNSDGFIGTWRQNIPSNVIGGTSAAAGNLDQGGPFTLSQNFGSLIIDFAARPTDASGAGGTYLSFTAELIYDWS